MDHVARHVSDRDDHLLTPVRWPDDVLSADAVLDPPALIATVDCATIAITSSG